ncbi:hypothetical protein EU528_08630 [Candidatus Thorarchaeota archaeon]|nr:MAG: hypothetical protein EU528_08630 [Candidatus Thorarchaeota archaeon]
MYKFGNKKNREDVIALRWPKACLSCGIDTPESVDPRHAIVGLFHVDKKTSRGDKRQTQILLKLPGFFYVCDECASVIDTATKAPSKNAKKMIETLQESPWMEFIELEKSGHVLLPDGLFKDKLQSVNPTARFKTKVNPMAVLIREIEKNTEGL